MCYSFSSILVFRCVQGGVQRRYSVMCKRSSAPPSRYSTILVPKGPLNHPKAAISSVAFVHERTRNHKNFSKWCCNSGVKRMWWSKSGPCLFRSFLLYALFVGFSLLLAKCSSLHSKEDKQRTHVPAGRQTGSLCCSHDQILLVMSRPVLRILKGPEKSTGCCFLSYDAPAVRSAAMFGTVDGGNILSSMCLFALNVQKNIRGGLGAL